MHTPLPHDYMLIIAMMLLLQYGQVMLEYRPVDCDSGVPLPFDPGYISRTDVYGLNGIQAGWSWEPFGAAYKKLRIPST